MSAPDVVIPRARFEAMARQCLALREQVDSLTLLIQSEIAAPAAVDPRAKDNRPQTFGSRSA